MPFLLDETAVIGMFFGLVLGGIGLMIGSYLFLQFGVRHFVVFALTNWGKAGRFALLMLVTTALDLFLFTLLIRSL